MGNKTFHQKSKDFYKTHAFECIVASASFIMIVFIGVLPCFFYFPLFLITLPLIICPGIFGLHVIVDMLEYKKGLPKALALSGFTKYFSFRFRGVYRVIIGLLKGMAAFFATLFLASVIYSLIATRVDAEFASTIEQIANYSAAGDIYTVDALLNTPCILRYVSTIFMFSTFVGMIFFIRHLGVHEQNFALRSHLLDGDMNSNRIFSRFYSSSRDGLKRSLRGVLAMESVIFALGYLAGVAVAYSTILDIDMRMPLFGLIGGLSFLGIYLPYFDRFSNLTSYYHSLSFREHVVITMEMELNQYNMVNPNEPDLPQIRELVKKARSELNAQKETFDGNDYPPDRTA